VGWVASCVCVRGRKRKTKAKKIRTKDHILENKHKGIVICHLAIRLAVILLFHVAST